MEQKSSMKETKMGNQGSSFISDPLFYGKVNMDPSEKAQLHSGDKVCHSFIPFSILFAYFLHTFCILFAYFLHTFCILWGILLHTWGILGVYLGYTWGILGVV